MEGSAVSSRKDLTTGVLLAKDGRTIWLGIPETDYRVQLGVYQEPPTDIGRRIRGTIRAQARRLDRSGKGGRYIEPVYGRPRRIQGHVIDVNDAERTVTINATVPFVCKADAHQRPSDFRVGDFVTCALESGAAFIASP